MVNQFRKYTQINILLLAVVGAVLCLGAFLHLPEGLMPVFFEPALANLVGQPTANTLDPSANVLLTLALTLVQALFLNATVSRFGLMGKPTYLPALMYVTLASTLLPFLVLSPVIICNVISIWLIMKLLHLYRSADIKGVMFDLGLIVALGSLIYFPFIAMLALLWISLYLFRPFSWREWVIPLIGFATVYFLLAVVYLLVDRMDEFYALWAPFAHAFPTSLHISGYDAVVLAPVLLILVLFLSILPRLFSKNVVHVRKTVIMLFYMVLIVAGSFYLNRELDVNHFLLAVPPLAIYAAYYFSLATKRWFYESAFALLVITIIVSQYF